MAWQSWAALHAGRAAMIGHTAFMTAFMTLSPAFADEQGAFGAVIRIERSAFGPDAGEISFAEMPLQTRNPIYDAAAYGAPPSGTRVSFGGFFEGQSLGQPGACPRGAAITGCVVGTPVSPLRLSLRATVTAIVKDGSNPHSPSLSGEPLFNGAIAILFEQDLAGVGLAGGYFNTERSTAIQAFDRSGRLIGSVVNIGLGMEYLALVTEDGSDQIAGILFSLVGPEQAGFGIDDLSFARAGQIDREQVPMLKDALAGFGAAPLGGATLPDQPKAEAEKPAQGGIGALFGEASPKPIPTLPITPVKPKAGSLADLFKP